MQIEKLKALYDECRKNPNYQYREMSNEDFLKSSLLSFKRLTDKQRDQACKSWAKKLGKADLSTQEIHDLVQYRFLIQSNLYFLAHVLELYNQTTIGTHEDICNEHFARKNPTFATFEQFANQYTDLKDTLLLVSRGGFKSSINMADCVQWVVAFPAITILILTGVYNLASDFVGEVKQHFTLDETGTMDSKGKMTFGPRQLFDKDTSTWSDSLFQILFPEHCIPPSEGSKFEFQTPAAGDKKEPSVRAASIEQALSGSHYDILKLDDVVTNENSLTIDRINKINKQISINRALLHPYGFQNTVGTWYDECLVGDTLITMSDWSQKPIKNIKIGDEVVGFTHDNDKRSMLVRSKVTRVFEPNLRKVNKYTFTSGRNVVATDSHLWWKGRGCNEMSSAYAKIGFKYHDQKFIRRLLVPSYEQLSKEHGYLAGLYDGEGSFQGNPGHPSGTITLCQSQHNPEVVDSMRKSLEDCGFEYSEYVSDPGHGWQIKHDFKILGGWKARYKFLSEVSPIRRDVIESSLFGQNMTEKDYLVSIEDAGEELTYCFETETHNYIADGCCSHNCDYYGIVIKQEETFAAEEGLLDNIKGSVDSGRFNSSVYVKVYLRAAWWPTEEAAKAGKIEEEMTKDDWQLWFPGRLTYEFLRKEQKKDGESGNFAIKYLNNPRKINKVKFPRELLVRRTIPHSQYPPSGIVVTTVDTAYSTKSWADYTVIMTSLIYGGRFYIINMVRGRYTDYELPNIIASTAFKWKPKRIAIEDSVGVKWMGRELRREMDKLRISIPVEFCSLGAGSKTRSKQMKAKPVLRLLGDERMFFFNSCEGLEEIYNELEKFTGTSADAHDDIVSAISLLAEQFGGYADMDSRMNSVEVDYSANRQDRAMHNMIYGLGAYQRFNASHMDVSDNPVSSFEMQNAPENQVTESYHDPLGDLF